jgi:hypothetical protein
VIPYGLPRPTGGRYAPRIKRFYYYQWADHPLNQVTGEQEYAHSGVQDRFGTGLSRYPKGTPAKPYCVFLNRNDPSAYNACPSDNSW